MVICRVLYLWLFEDEVISIIFVIWCVIIADYLKCRLIICYLDYLWLFDYIVSYLMALHGAKILFYFQFRIAKSPSQVPGIEPDAFRCRIAYVTTALHRWSNIYKFIMVYNQFFIIWNNYSNIVIATSVVLPLPLRLLSMYFLVVRQCGRFVVDVVVQLHVLCLMLPLFQCLQ